MAIRRSGYTVVLEVERPLRNRCIQLLQKLADDRTLNQAAVELHMSMSNANQTIAVARERLGKQTTYGAIVEALRRGIITMPPQCAD